MLKKLTVDLGRSNFNEFEEKKKFFLKKVLHLSEKSGKFLPLLPVFLEREDEI
jgi:hypothetical protein